MKWENIKWDVCSCFDLCCLCLVDAWLFQWFQGAGFPVEDAGRRSAASTIYFGAGVLFVFYFACLFLLFLRFLIIARNVHMHKTDK